MSAPGNAADPLESFHAPTRAWFTETFGTPTGAQRDGWPAIAAGRSTLILAPTGSGKTLAAFLAALDRLAFAPATDTPQPPGVRVLYVSPLKALAVDVERNLRVPRAGIAATAKRLGVPHRVPTVGIRSGDTTAADRRRLVSRPPDVLITTPESLYLMLTSRAADTLRSVETVIVDEIHAVAGTKRGVHLFVSLERLEDLRDPATPLQRIGLSATQRPLDEIARLLGGGVAGRSADEPFRSRPVHIVDAGRRRPLEITLELTADDFAQPGIAAERAGVRTPATAATDDRDDDDVGRTTVWTTIHPRLVELIRAHNSTIVFTNSRRLAERIAGAINDEAGEELALAHHGSIAKDLRLSIEERLKDGELPAIVATASLELGIDMGAVDLVVQIEAPVSVASGLQRIGRAGHSVDAVSKGIVIPKHRHDLLAAAAAVGAMQAGRVEATHYPRNPLDVLAQQIVATVARRPGISVDRLFALLRRAAPFADLARTSFEGVLDLLSGRYPSDRFGDLRPRVTWDRLGGTLTARRGAGRLAVMNPGTIPDRGLFGVFLAGTDRPVRVGELDEEMVFETIAGEVFLLGASAWRVVEITHDRVTVTPAPGELGRMPFWKGGRPGRPVDFGRAIGQLTARIAKDAPGPAMEGLRAELPLDEVAARNLVAYVHDQRAATGVVPTDTTVVVERFQDEVGDWCVCLHTPFGGRVHAPWGIAVQARLRRERGLDAQALWADDGIVFRFPETDDPPPVDMLFPTSDEVESLVTARLADTSLFASHFRENAVRALLLPRRDPRRRRPLWVQRRRAADLLQVASDFPDFPMLLETYRECLRDVFDLPALRELLRDVERGTVSVHVADTRKPSPFAASLLFAYAGNFIYDDDQPLAERRAAALSLDHAALRALLGEPELRELLDAAVVRAEESRLQRLTPGQRIRHADALHDALIAIGPLARDEIRERSELHAGMRAGADDVDAWAEQLLSARRAIEVRIGDAVRLAAVEDAARLRDALGVALPPGLPDALLAPAPEPLLDLVSRHARTHGPFDENAVATRLGLGRAVVRHALAALEQSGRVVSGEFLPGGTGPEWCSVDVMRRLKQRSLAAARREIEPVAHATLARFAADWHAISPTRDGQRLPVGDALIAAVERLQGAALPASDLEAAILPVRVPGFEPRHLDALCSAGDVLWRGAGAIGPRDGRVVLYLAEDVATLAAPAERLDSELASSVRRVLEERGALFFDDLVRTTNAFVPDLIDALWELVWNGEVTNDTLLPLRSRRRPEGVAKDAGGRRRSVGGRSFVTRRTDRRPGTEGRWSLFRSDTAVSPTVGPAVSPTVGPAVRAVAHARQLLIRHGVVCRETVSGEGSAGGFAAVYPVLRTMEEAGRVRRGYFVEGLGAAQFAQPGADDRLRTHRRGTRKRQTTPQHALVLAASDPAQPFGSTLPWPAGDPTQRPTRAAGARCILWDGALIGHLSPGGKALSTFLPDASDAAHASAAAALVEALVASARRAGLSLARIDGRSALDSALAAALTAAGFRATTRGLTKPRERG